MDSTEISHPRTTAILVLLLLLLIIKLPVSSQEAQQNNTWYSRSNSDTVFIFVHGLFSNAKECWTAPNKAYWPEILKTDTRFGDPHIFLGGYYTQPTSGVYGIYDAADELLSHLRVKNPQGIEGPLAKQKIVFIAHSTGGIRQRKLCYQNQFFTRPLSDIPIGYNYPRSYWIPGSYVTRSSMSAGSNALPRLRTL
jgi:hypothetical protein